MFIAEGILGEVGTCEITGVKHVSEFEGGGEESGAEDRTSGKVDHGIK